MKGHGEKLTRKQDQVIAALLLEPTLVAAASRCGVSESTLWRWLQDPQFNAAYRLARRSVVDTVVASPPAAGAEAVAALRRNLNCGQPGAEVRAAGVVLDHVLGTLEQLDLEERLQRLETLPQDRDANDRA